MFADLLNAIKEGIDDVYNQFPAILYFESLLFATLSASIIILDIGIGVMAYLQRDNFPSDEYSLFMVKLALEITIFFLLTVVCFFSAEKARKIAQVKYKKMDPQ
jgi:hypothetical protein